MFSIVDAFEMFDKDGSGRIDEEEFHFLLKYLNIDIDEHTHEKFFRKYGSDKSGYIEYPEFKKAWLRLGNTRKELETREIQIPTLATRAQMIGMLDKILEEEESQEQLAIEEAKKYRLMQERLKYMKEYIGKAKHQSNVELSAALDAGGSVYVFGSGTLNQFSKPPRSNNVNQPFHLKGYDRLLSLWQSRVGGSCGGSRERGMHHMKPISLEEELKLGFNNIDNATGLNGLVHLDQEFNLQTNTVWLWGRQCKGVVVSNNVILAHSKNGALYSWGGNEQWWHQLENDSCWQTKTRGLLTARSRGLLGFPSDQDANSFSQKSGNTISSKSEKSEELLVVIRTVLQYYNAWSTPDGQTNSLDHAKKSLKDNIDRQRVSWSLKLRDKPTDNLTKLEMVKILHRDILLEYKLLGEPEHLELRELEMEMIEMRQQQKLKLAKRRRLRFIEKWRPLREAQKLDAHSILIEKNKGIGELSTSSSDQEHNLRVKKLSEKDDDRFESKADGFVVKGITPRGPQPSSVVSSSSEEWEMIDAGANHAGMVDNKGRLFTWGSNTTGQLGILEEATNSNNCRQQEGLEKFQPKKVNILNVSKFSCGHSHTAAVDKSGKLYVWGSASCGKLGLGSSVSNTECYASIPVILKSLSTKRIIVVSCGSGHTACVEGDNGGFYVWGDGGGGRLGLGHKRDVFAPTLVKSLSGERIVDVSCGNCQTLAITAIDESVAFCNQSKVKNISGGKLLVAGPKEVVGYDFSSFGEYSFFTNDDNEIGPEPVRNISAGFTHQSIITSNGELFIWGDNYNGCCGKDYAKFHFLSTPTKVKLYENPIDLAEGKKTHQSIPYGTQPFFEVDLGQVALIREIKLWNDLEVPNNPAVRKNKFTGRLFPCWIMIAPEPFPDNIGEGQLQAALDYCSCKKRFDENQQKSCWKRKCQFTNIKFAMISNCVHVEY